MLSLEAINSSYSEILILKEIALSIREGEVVGLVGGNGAGKTATLKTISGLIRAKSGKILFCDEDITSLPPYEIVEKGLILVPEGRKIFPSLTVHENLDLGAFNKRAKVNKIKNYKAVFQLFPVLKERLGQPAGTLSGGEQQMLAIGRGLMSSPKLLMLDEPSIGLAPIIVKEMFDIIKHINQTGTTLLLVEQNVRQSLTLADRAYVLENGRITNQGTGHELLKDYHVIKSYLGL